MCVSVSTVGRAVYSDLVLGDRLLGLSLTSAASPWALEQHGRNFWKPSKFAIVAGRHHLVGLVKVLGE